MTRLGVTDHSVTSAMTTAFVGAARREPFRYTARLVKLGRRLVYGLADTTTNDGRLLTHHTLTYTRPPENTSPEADDS
jgi:acyl-coenzyme A thioesterase PaaI-like protein